MATPQQRKTIIPEKVTIRESGNGGDFPVCKTDGASEAGQWRSLQRIGTITGFESGSFLAQIRQTPTLNMFCRSYFRALLRGLAASLMLWPAITPTMAGGDKDAANGYMTGAEVMIDAPVSGDLFAAAGRISVDHPVSGDAVLAAGSIDLRSGIGDDLRAAGGFVSVTGRVSGEALIAGGSIAF